MGAPESNAGDDFHFWWSASRALELIRPGTELRKLTLEGLGTVDDPDDSSETVDVGEFFGGADMATASAIAFSQLKYSTRHPDQLWTVARLTARHRRRNPDGTSAPDRSVAADLAEAYRQVVVDQGVEIAAKVTIALVSNQPGDPLLLQAVAAAAGWARTAGAAARRSGMSKALDAEHAAVIQQLARLWGQGWPVGSSAASWLRSTCHRQVQRTVPCWPVQYSRAARSLLPARAPTPPTGCTTSCVNRPCPAVTGA